MGLEEVLKPDQLAQEITNPIYQRLVQSGLSQEDVQYTANVVFEFVKIACSLLANEPGINNPETNTLLPFDETMAKQSIQLFAEGVCHTSLKSNEMGIPAELKAQFLQSAAQDIFLQAKQIVLTTVGQENTPEYQITQDQQYTWITQTAESALVYYLQQYEKQNGPLPTVQALAQPVMPSPEEGEGESLLPSAPPMPLAEEGVIESPPVQYAGSQPTPITTTKSDHPHDKYAAVALLLSTLPWERREGILRRFSAEERKTIQFYQTLENIEQNLNLKSVHQHLENFKKFLKQQQQPKQKTETMRGFEALAHQWEKDELLSLVPHERAGIHQYLASYFIAEEEEETLAFWEQAPQKQKPKLPPAVEEVLYAYVTQQLQQQVAQR